MTRRITLVRDSGKLSFAATRLLVGNTSYRDPFLPSSIISSFDNERGEGGRER